MKEISFGEMSATCPIINGFVWPITGWLFVLGCTACTANVLGYGLWAYLELRRNIFSKNFFTLFEQIEFHCFSRSGKWKNVQRCSGILKKEWQPWIPSEEIMKSRIVWCDSCVINFQASMCWTLKSWFSSCFYTESHNFFFILTSEWRYVN